MMKLVQRRSLAAILALLLLLLFALPAAAQVQGKPLVTVAGAVTGEDGKPLPGAKIEVFSVGRVLAAWATTDADGEFRITLAGERNTAFAIRAWATGYETTETTWAWIGEEPFLRLTLTPLHGSLSGWVIGPSGYAVHQAQVELLDGAQRPVASTQTTHTGRFWFDRVRAGEAYSLRVSATGLTPVIQPVGEVTGGQERSLTVALGPYQGQVVGSLATAEGGLPLVGASVAVEQVGVGLIGQGVTGAGGSFSLPVPVVAGANYRLHATASGYYPTQTAPFALDAQGWARLDGDRRVILARVATEVSVWVVDPDNRPMPNAPLWLEREGVGIVATGTTGSDGTFRWTEELVTGERYRVRTAPFAARLEATERLWSPVISDWQPALPGQRSTVTLRMASGVVEDLGQAEILGRITDASGTPISGATVELLRADKGVLRSTQTLADGSYRLDGVPANRLDWKVGTGYILRVEGREYHVAASQVIHVTPRQQMVLDFALMPLTGGAAIHLLDQQGAPIAGAQLRLTDAMGGAPILASTDANGVARLRAPIGRPYKLEVERDGYHRAQVTPLLLTPGQEVAVTLTVGAAGTTLFGHVSGFKSLPAGDPLRVEALTPDGKRWSERLRPDGSYELIGLPPSIPVLLTLYQGERPVATLEQVLVTPTGGRAQADLSAMAQSGSIQGKVRMGMKQEIEVEVSLWHAGEGLIATTRTTPDGRYRFDGLPTGHLHRYVVTVEGMGVTYPYRAPSGYWLPPLISLGLGETAILDLEVRNPTE